MNIILHIINKALQASNKQVELAKYCGRSFIIKSFGELLTISALIDSDGSLLPYNLKDYTTEIEVKPSSAIKYAINKDKLAIIKTINITKDKEFALIVLEIFSNLNFVDVEYFANPLANKITWYMQKLTTIFAGYIKSAVSDLVVTSVDYVVYQRGDIVGRIELEEFYDQVDELRARFDSLYTKFMINRQ